jgi:HTH-type transcriptional regulator/antitoxin HigA
MLVYDYEEQHEPMPTLTGIPLLKALMEESNFQPKDLVAIFGSETTVLEVLNDKVQLSDRQIQELASVFHISPAALSPS